MPTQWSDEIVLATLPPEPELSEELLSLFTRLEERSVVNQGSPNIVLSFGEVQHLNSSHLAQLLKLRRRTNELGRSLILCGLHDDLWSIMLVTGLDKVFRFAPDTMTALASLQIEEKS